MKVLDIIYGGESDNHQANDVKLMIKNKGLLPFLVFPDGFVDDRTILKESLHNNDANLDLYGKDEEDNELEVKKMCNITSSVAGTISLYFSDTGNGYLTSVPPTQTVDPNFFRNRSLITATSIYPASYNDQPSGESLMITNDYNYFSLPKPDDDFGRTITVKTILIGGVKTFSRPNRHKLDIDGGSIYTENTFLPMIEIDTNKFDDWDPKTLPFYTLVQESNNIFRPLYVGPQDTKKYYIPLI